LGVSLAGTADTTGDQLSGITITTAGTGYQVGDTVLITEDGGTGNAGATVTAIV